MNKNFAVIEELPEADRGGTPGKYVEELHAAQVDHPGQWCRILKAKRVTSYVTSFRRSHEQGLAYAVIDLPNFEFASRKQVDGSEYLYARYTG